MRIPKTTKEKPYIQFVFTEQMKLKLSICEAIFWGGKDSGFYGSEGVGNTCPPVELPEYLKAFKQRQIKQTEQEIARLKKRIEKLKNIPEL